MAELHQNSTDIDKLYDAAENAHPEIKGLLECALPLSGGEIVMPPLKGRERAMQKISQDYEGDASRIKDILRGTIIVNTLEEARQVERFLEHYGQPIGPVKDRFKKPLSRGYRNITRTMKASNGHIAEVQIHLREFYLLEKQTHAHYEKIRELTDRLDKKGDLYLVEKIAEKTRRLEKEMQEITLNGDPSMLKEISRTTQKIGDLQKKLGGNHNLNDIGLIAKNLHHLHQHVDNLGATNEMQMPERIREDIDELTNLMGDIGQKADLRLIKEIRTESDAIRSLYDEATLAYNEKISQNMNPKAEKLMVMEANMPSNIPHIKQPKKAPPKVLKHKGQ